MTGSVLRHPWLVRARTVTEQFESSAMALRPRGDADGETPCFWCCGTAACQQAAPAR
ncbi:MAG TPA: hypothetical protein VFE59_13265 [Trebonia sp.]|nr:hypothetical protein [Trebonia sp.]